MTFCCRESLNAPGCDAIHITEIDADIECDTFIPAIDSSVFQPWYSSFPSVENKLRFSFTTYVRVRNSGIGYNQTSCVIPDNGLDIAKFEVKTFSFLPKMIFERHEEYMYLRLVEDIISNGTSKDDRTGTGTLSKFGCQVLQSCFKMSLSNFCCCFFFPAETCPKVIAYLMFFFIFYADEVQSEKIISITDH